ncbi:MAG: MarR family winged helix-turn-helix transcriptional regulator [Solirubrobacteraceae bacterium]|jgi:DNA-binding MarR family transcriptional regulator
MSRENDRWEEVRMELGNEFRYLQTDFEDIDTAVAEYFGLNKTDMRVLDFATRGEKPITAGEIATESRLSTGAVTAVIDRLEKAGWVRRRHDPDDRRRVLVEITEQAQARMDEVWGPMIERGRRRHRHYTVEQLEFLRDFMRLARAETNEHAERIRQMTAKRKRDAAA